MNIQEYQIYCEQFFREGYFQSEETLCNEISHLSEEEFTEWELNMIAEYNIQKYDFVYNIIKDMREKENFHIDGIHTDDIDWDKDPIHKEENKIIIEAYRKVNNDVFNNELKKFNIYQQRINERRTNLKNKMYEESLKITVDGKEFIAQQVIDVLWGGWDRDTQVWLVVDEGQKKLVTTDNGQFHFTDKSFLEKKINEYQEAIDKSQEMLNQL